MSQSTVHPLDELMHYATTPDADLKTVVGGLLVCSDATTLTIVDCYRKAHYHRLILPRPRDGVPTADLRDLPTLFAGGKERARAVLADLGRAAEASKASIEADMLERWKFKWDVWVGFHAVPSMRHLHMHVISADLVSHHLKKKKHYNSFHPKLGFFLHYTDVMEWFEATPSYYERMIQVKPKTYEHLLKEDLMCFHCDKAIKNMPALTMHLQSEFDEMKDRGRTRELNRKARLEKKRKREEELAAAAETAPSAGPSTGSSQASAVDDAPPAKRATPQGTDIED